MKSLTLLPAKRGLAPFCLAFLLAIPATAGPIDGYVFAEPKETPEELFAAILSLTNAERKKARLQPLVMNEILSQAAMFKAKDLTVASVFGHKDSAGRSPKDRAEMFGYKDWTRLSENIAGGYFSADEVVTAWMASPGHRRNILDPKVSELGLGFCFDKNSKYGWYWVQKFGRRSGSDSSRAAEFGR